MLHKFQLDIPYHQTIRRTYITVCLYSNKLMNQIYFSYRVKFGSMDIVQHLNYSGAYHFAWLAPLLLLFYFHMPKFRKLRMIHLLKFQQRLCLGCKISNCGNIVKKN